MSNPTLPNMKKMFWTQLKSVKYLVFWACNSDENATWNKQMKSVKYLIFGVCDCDENAA